MHRGALFIPAMGVCVLMDSERESILKVGRDCTEQRKRGTEGSSRLFVVGWLGESVERRWVVNVAADEGRRGAEVLQRSWELFFLTPGSQVKWER